jgi:DNA primase
MKYRNAPKMQARELLYPYDVVYKYLQKELAVKTAVLVEGPVDALRLVYNRIPAFAILGTNNYDPSNKFLLMNLGIERVILAMDSDEAGKKARYAIEPDLESWFEVEHFFPPWKEDPGGMEDKYVKKLKQQALRLE